MPEQLMRIISKPYVLFPIISFVFGLIFVIITPPLWGFDEAAHFARSYQIVHGQLLPDATGESYGGNMPKNYADLHWYRGADMLDDQFKTGPSVLQRQDVTDKKAYDRILSQKFSNSQTRFPWTALYSPVSYPGSITAVFISKTLSLTIGQTLFLTRFMSLLIYIILASCALYILREYKRLVWLVFLVVLLPTCISQAATVNADGILMSLTTAFVALYVSLLTKKRDTKRNWKLLGLVLIGVLLPLIKINFIIVSLTILLIPAADFLSRKTHILFKIMTALATVLPGIVWLRASGSAATPPQSQRQDLLPVHPGDQVIHILSHPFDFLIALIKTFIVYGNDTIQGLFFTLSGNGITMPIALLFAIVVSVVILGLNARADILKIRKEIIIVGIAAMITIVATYIALYAVFNPVGWWFIDGVQGRYFTPLIIPIILSVVVILPVKARLREDTSMYIAVSVALVTLVVATGYDYLALY